MRTYKSKNVQTKPSKAGEQNMSDEYVEAHKDVDGAKLMSNVSELFNISCEQRRRGTNWKPEELEEQISAYFEFCVKREMKPCKSGLQLYLGVGKSQYYDWGAKPEKYGGISEVINQANIAMETQYINRGEKYPTMNIFLLKTSHGHIEQSKVDVTTNGKEITNPEEVKDLVTKLGLDKK